MPVRDALKAMLHEAIFLATSNATMTNKKPFKLQRRCHTFATLYATCNAYDNKQDGGRHLEISRERKMSSDWPILTTCLVTLPRRVEGRSTFLATRKWGVTREFFLATCNATFVAMRVARKMPRVSLNQLSSRKCCKTLGAGHLINIVYHFVR